jgi:hypothetical protein
MTKSVQMNIKYLLIIVLLSFALLFRFYNFTDRINFGPEQALSLITSAEYLEKPSLLGIPSVRRTTSAGHIIFFEPFYTYTLVPFLLLFNYDPIPITAVFGFLNILFGLILFLIVKKYFDYKTAVFTLVLYLFNSLMVAHSLFIWINNYIPYLTIIMIYFFLDFFKKESFKSVIAIGFLSGLVLGLQYLFLLTGLPLIVLLVIYISKKKLINISAYLTGFLTASLPTIIFDLKHDLYNANTLWQYFLDTINNPGQSELAYYHFFHFWPLFFLVCGILLAKLYKVHKVYVAIIMFLYLFLNLNNRNISINNAVGMPDGINYKALDRVSEIIAFDNPVNFNVATTYDFDTRAHPLRYMLTYRYGTKPNGIDEYPQSSILYVLSNKEYNFTNAPWEISSFETKKINLLFKGNSYFVYKLDK